ncbi:MAG: arginine--tRNA ligase [Candidatus Handelsmanbacteria bacterium]|nr:arginine--tRNA ligase [Candidatus Handelsmanbacteria bacterium]
MTLRHLLESRLTQALQKAGAPSEAPPMLGPATRPEFGDYQGNGVMGAAKKMGLKPRELAEKVVAALDLEGIAEKVEIAGPGFINITLKSAWLAGYVNGVLADERLGVATTAAPQTVVVDYSHPNLAKEMHVGHLRSTIIGDALVRILEFLGHRVIRHNHVGDWGTQFGMLIAHLDHFEGQGQDVSGELADLEEFYRVSKQRFDEDAGFARIAREYVVRLQGGDPNCLEVWQRFVGESLSHCEQVYARLGVTLKREDVRPESAYNDDLPCVVEDLRKAGLLRQSQGALCVFLEEFKDKEGEITPVIIQKSDGAYLYATTDLAAVRYRARQLKADRVLYVVDARQDLHLRQVFAVARAADFAPASCSLEHHAFGTMMGRDGKPFRTRQGGTVKLLELLDEAEARAFALVSEKNPDLAEEERRQIARVAGIGSVKYADLSLNRTTDYLFDWDKMLALDGNTAPYLQYSYARVQSIFRRGDLEAPGAQARLLIAEPAEKTLALKLAHFAETVEGVASECYPNMLCAYLYSLAETFMRFYETCPVLKAEDPVRQSRLLLCQGTARTIRTGLGLLGIETVERM